MYGRPRMPPAAESEAELLPECADAASASAPCRAVAAFAESNNACSQLSSNPAGGAGPGVPSGAVGAGNSMAEARFAGNTGDVAPPPSAPCAPGGVEIGSSFCGGDREVPLGVESRPSRQAVDFDSDIACLRRVTWGVNAGTDARRARVARFRSGSAGASGLATRPSAFERRDATGENGATTFSSAARKRNRMRSVYAGVRRFALVSKLSVPRSYLYVGAKSTSASLKAWKMVPSWMPRRSWSCSSSRS
mmetsp:Transcript_46703/g.144032  ORF Transcript_46703/g.144032 Transcript_46703/m.144032 type:complete len:249 (-) Transcript_46703:1268-2014(-)